MEETAARGTSGLSDADKSRDLHIVATVAVPHRNVTVKVFSYTDGKETKLLVAHERDKRRYHDNIKVDPKGITCEDIKWIELVQDIVRPRDFVTTVMNVYVLCGASENCTEHEFTVS
jgi:hypothetical protein